MNFQVTIPEIDKDIKQDEELFLVEYNHTKEIIRARDYDKIFSIPGLYEYLFYDRCKCDSPNVVCSLLEHEVTKASDDMSNLRVIDLGAGNGIVGEALHSSGAEIIIGLDIIEEAAEAVKRDRPGVYDEFFTEDLTMLPEAIEADIKKHHPNCITTVAAPGFEDIQPDAFAAGFNLISEDGWVAFNIKDEIYGEKDQEGFAGLINRMADSDVLTIQAEKRYRHRFGQDGAPLNYYAVVARKKNDIPDYMVNSNRTEKFHPTM